MLKKTILTFLFATILTAFYGYNATFDTRSFDELVADSREATVLDDDDCVISIYDAIIRQVSEREGNDWRLMSAIAYHESRFSPTVVSRRGARGLMQIMPSVARQFKVAPEQVLDPHTNVWIANKLIHRIAGELKMPASTPATDRMSLILASYNGGIGHVNDARRLASYHGENPNSWEVVSRYLELKSQPEYYKNEVVRCGRFTGINQTRAYVDDVMGRYGRYCRMTAQ